MPDAELNCQVVGIFGSIEAVLRGMVWYVLGADDYAILQCARRAQHRDVGRVVRQKVGYVPRTWRLGRLEGTVLRVLMVLRLIEGEMVGIVVAVGAPLLWRDHSTMVP
jgi:hypothetical protein